MISPVSEPPAVAGLPALRLDNISKRFGAVRALSHVNFEVAASEVVALIGDNGAGKSTLIKIISGVEQPDEGIVEVAGHEAVMANPQVAARLGIATVFQDLALCENLDVVANLHLGQEWMSRRLARIGWLDEIGMERSARELIKTLGVNIPNVRKSVVTLSGGQRQSVAVARALLGEPKVILLDEPTAALGVEATEHVLELVVRLRDRGLGVVLVSHNLANVFSVADRAVVLRLGTNNGVFDLSRSGQEEIIAAITGGRVSTRKSTTFDGVSR